MLRDAQAVAAQFAAAVAQADAVAAAACCSVDAWSAAHGDSPQRLFRKASDARRGFALQVGETMVAHGASDGQKAARAAVNVDLIRRRADGSAHAMATVALLLESSENAGNTGQKLDWSIVGICKMSTWQAAFLRGDVPALLQYEALDSYPPAGDGLTALCMLAQRAMTDSAEATDAVTALLNDGTSTAKVMARIQHLISLGHSIDVRDCRWLPGTQHAVVRAVLEPVLESGTARELWIHAAVRPTDMEDGLLWLAVEETLRTEAWLVGAS